MSGAIAATRYSGCIIRLAALQLISLDSGLLRFLSFPFPNEEE
jgi:hypothetical protein